MNRKAIQTWGLFAIFVLFIVAGILNFFGEKLGVGSLDAMIGCPIHAIPGLGGFIGGFTGCGFLGIFNLIVVVAFVGLLIFTLQG